MSNVIAFLESLGRDATAQPSGSEFAVAVDALQLDDNARHALLSGDVDALSALLGGRSRMLCALLPADDDEDGKEDDGDGDDDDGGKKAPDKSPSIGLH